MKPTTQHPEDDVTQQLRQNVFSAVLNSGGVKRADGAQLPSNIPCEDTFNRAQEISLPDGETWVAATIFDGHYGPHTADYLEKNLLSLVESKLSKLQTESRSDEKIQLTIEESFTELDNLITDRYAGCAENTDLALQDKIHIMHIAASGSCALLVLYNHTRKTIYTACTGDSRAVLGQQIADGTWESVALSADQKGGNEAEMERIRKEHPDEEAATKDGKVLGMSVTRAFGDFRWKSSHEKQMDQSMRFISHGAMKPEEIPTPPYLTAKPVITVTMLEANQSAVLVMASDGLWDECENAEAVDLVVRWLEAQPETSLKAMKMELKRTPKSVWWKRDPPPAPEPLPPGFDFLARKDQFEMRFLPDRTTIEDLDNAAVHLLRNVCGGSLRELVAAKLAYRPPYARYVRDDMTIQVLFF